LFVFFLSGIVYLYALNRGAVQGYETKTLEREIAELKKENGKLKLSEAEVLSLSRIESAVKDRGMSQAEPVRMVEGRGPLALR
jgi:cell division protein FtsL